MSSRVAIGARAPADHDAFRDELASIAQDGRRRWVYARRPVGPLYRARTIVSVGLLAFLLLAPFVRVHGQPLMLLNVLERRFVLLGVVFRPQDFYLIVLIALTALVTLVLSTVVVGRIWCGWLCPQTIFMEMVFRRIEYAIEGSAEQQVRRNRSGWTREKAIRRGSKHLVFLALSFVIANVFLAWIIGARELLAIVTDSPRRHLAGLAAILIFSIVFYLVFARFREQACVLACPYGRVLSSLIDRRTITVTYDSLRGEPRGRLVAVDRSGGDCIDCHQCVTVCPTGIDIRNGIQLECVSCTACIDACNAVMRRVGRQPGLIRHTSAHAIASAAPRAAWWSTRVAAYGVVWIGLVVTVVTLLVTRPGLDVLILRQPGTMYATVAGGDLANFYTVQALNRTGRSTAFAIEVVEPRGATVTLLGPSGQVDAYGVAETRILLRVPPDALSGATTPVTFVVQSHGRIVQQVASAFLGPALRAARAGKE